MKLTTSKIMVPFKITQLLVLDLSDFCSKQVKDQDSREKTHVSHLACQHVSSLAYCLPHMCIDVMQPFLDLYP